VTAQKHKTIATHESNQQQFTAILEIVPYRVYAKSTTTVYICSRFAAGYTDLIYLQYGTFFYVFKPVPHMLLRVRFLFFYCLKLFGTYFYVLKRVRKLFYLFTCIMYYVLCTCFYAFNRDRYLFLCI
jgi:hypothetical protein